MLLSLNGATWEAADGYVVEFGVHRTQISPSHPHGISYALVFRTAVGKPIVRFDNAHVVERPGGRFVKALLVHDHWHRSEEDPGRPYAFTTATQLLDDLWREVKRAMNERAIANDL